MRSRGGYLRVGAIVGVPIFLHWSLPIGLFVFSGFAFLPEIFVGVFALILVHELGHALVAKLRRCPVQAIEIHAVGGLCRAQSKSDLDVIVISWGGVLAQLWLYVLAVGYFLVWPPFSAGAVTLRSVLVDTNLMIAALNLIPIAPFDGADAWRILPALGWFRRTKRVAPLTAQDDPRARDAFPEPKGERAQRVEPAESVEAEVARTVKEALARARDESRSSRGPVK